MGKYKVEFERQALKDLETHKKVENKSTINKINKIVTVQVVSAIGHYSDK